jgi:hypothetical protein|tara:strand:+ start:588 stop:974 length:387 start_codon:yes stop_codon:yes gene_type:complete
MKDSVKTFLIVALAFFTLMLTALTTNAQDTICIMLTHEEQITFNFQTSEVIHREPLHDTIAYIRVESDEVLCLHLYDEKRRFRDITTTWDDGDHRHDTFPSKDDVYFTAYGYGGIDVEVSPARRRKKS